MPLLFGVVSSAGGGYFGSGIDGDLSVSTATSVNSYAYITDSSRTTSQNSCTVDTTTGFSVNQRVLIHQTQCATNTALAGKFKETRITNISGNVITFADNFAWAVASNTANSSSANMCQIVSIPQYRNVTINSGGTLTPGAYWNGQKGGILIFEAAAAVTVNAGGTISANAFGFRGGNGGDAGSNAISFDGGNGGWSGEGVTGGGKKFGIQAAKGGAGASGNGGVGHVNLHGVIGGNGYYNGTVRSGSGGIGYGAGGGSNGSDTGGGGGAGGAGGGLTLDTSTYRVSLGGGAGGGGGGSCGNNNQQNGGPGGGGGAGGGLIIIRCENVTNSGTISARPGYGAGAPGVTQARGTTGTDLNGGAGGDASTNGNGQKNGNEGGDLSGSYATATNVNATAGGSGTGVGGPFGYGSTAGSDLGGGGGWTGVSGGGNGGGGSDNGTDGGPGGGAGASGGGGGGSGWDVGSGGGGGQGASAGVLWIECLTFTNSSGTVTMPRGVGGGGGGTTSGGSGNGLTGGDAQFNPSSGTGYRNGASGYLAGGTGWSGGGGAAGYVGSIGNALLYTTSGSYSGTITATDNGQAQTGVTVSAASLPINVSPFIW